MTTALTRAIYQFHPSRLGVAPTLIINTEQIPGMELGKMLNQVIAESTNTVICVADGTPDLHFLEHAIQAVSGSGSARIIFKRYEGIAIVAERDALRQLGFFPDKSTLQSVYEELLATVTKSRRVGAIELQRPLQGAIDRRSTGPVKQMPPTSFGADVQGGDPSVAVLRIDFDHLRLGEETLTRWLAGQLSRSIPRHDFTLPLHTNFDETMQSMHTALQAVESAYLLVHHQNIRYRDDIIPLLLEVIKSSSHARGVAFAINDGNGEKNLLKEARSYSYQELCRRDARFQDPFYLMAHCIFAREFLVRMVTDSQHNVTRARFGELLWEAIRQEEIIIIDTLLADDLTLDKVKCLTASFVALDTPFIFSKAVEKATLESGNATVNTITTLTEVAVAHLQADSNLYALTLLRRILELSPDQTLLYYAKAIVEARLRRFTDAQSTLADLLRRDPVHTLGRELLSYCQSVTGTGVNS